MPTTMTTTGGRCQAAFSLRREPELRVDTHLLLADAIVLQEDEAVVPDGDLDRLDELVDDRRVIRVHLAQVDRRQLGKVVCLFGDRRRIPGPDVGLAGKVGRGRVEGGGGRHWQADVGLGRSLRVREMVKGGGLISTASGL